MAKPRVISICPPYTPHPYQCCSRCPPGLAPPAATAAAVAAPTARARSASPHRAGPGAPAGRQGPGDSQPCAGATSPGGEGPGALSERGRGAARALAERGSAARPHQSPAPPPPPAHLPRTEQEAPGPATAATMRQRPALPLGDREPPAPPATGASGGWAPVRARRRRAPPATHTRRGERQKADGLRGCGGRSHLSCRARGARPRLTCPGPDSPRNAHGSR